MFTHFCGITLFCYNFMFASISTWHKYVDKMLLEQNMQQFRKWFRKKFHYFVFFGINKYTEWINWNSLLFNKILKNFLEFYYFWIKKNHLTVQILSNFHLYRNTQNHKFITQLIVVSLIETKDFVEFIFV